MPFAWFVLSGHGDMALVPLGQKWLEHMALVTPLVQSVIM
jgi:hypothetical protein